MGALFLTAAHPDRVDEEKGGSDAPNGRKHAQHPRKLLIVLILMLLDRCRASFDCWIAEVVCAVIELTHNVVHRSEKIHEEGAAFRVFGPWDNWNLLFRRICQWIRRVYCWCRHDLLTCFLAISYFPCLIIIIN